MKNFQEIADARPNMLHLITLHLTPIYFNETRLQCKIQIQDKVVHDGPLLSGMIFKYPIHIDDPLCIKIDIHGKKATDVDLDNNNDTAIIVEKLTYDDKKLPLTYYDGKKIIYYVNENGDELFEATYLGSNGCWKLDTRMPISHWHRQITNEGWIA